MKKTLQVSGTLAVVSLMLLGCGDHLTSGPSDRQELRTRVDALKQGTLIDQINQANLSTHGKEGEDDTVKNPTGTGVVTEPGTGTTPSLVATNTVVPAPPETDPCPDVAKPEATAAEEAMAAALADFGKCLIKTYHPVEVLTETINYLRLVKPTLPEKSLPLSEWTIEDLDVFQKDAIKKFSLIRSSLGLGSPYEAELRTSYSDDDLKEIVALVRRRTNQFRKVEKQIYAAVDARMDLVSHYGTGDKRINRYVALLALRQTADDKLGKRTTTALKRALTAAGTPFEIPGEILRPPGLIGLSLIHPYALGAILPDPGKEMNPLHPVLENPFDRVRTAIGDLAGHPSLSDNAVHIYGLKRDLKVPAFPEHPAAAEDAVRVAFMDSGIDFEIERDLGMFLGNGTSGQLNSEDLTGVNGHNPWGPIGMSEFSHGSMTTATLLTLLANLAPEILEERKLDLAMWKFKSDTTFLSGPMTKAPAWTPMLTVNHNLMKKIAIDEVKPKILSMSMSMGLWPYLEKAGKQDLVKTAPWLWIMSAGNEGRTLDKPWDEMSGDDAVCLEDVPAEHRNDSNILCVGALIQGIVKPKIADYSNFGKRVDVYAFESYTKLCPNGTSCSAPAITAAVTIIAHHYPKLTPAQLKEVIVEAAEERELEVGLSESSRAEGKLVGRLGSKETVKVFNPIGMMPKALAIAKKKAGL